MNMIIDKTLSLWNSGRNTKMNSNGWLVANAVCCPHNGETVDRRGRGGLIQTGNTLTYHCFNCGFKTKYVEDTHLSKNFQNLMRWMGGSDADIQQCVMFALKNTNYEAPIIEETIGLKKPNFNFYTNLPQAKSFNTIIKSIQEGTLSQEYIRDFQKVYQYAYDRKFFSDDSNTNTRHGDILAYAHVENHKDFGNLKNSILFIGTYKKIIYGYSARTIDQTKKGAMRYINKVPGDFIYNLDSVTYSTHTTIVVEGQPDALAIDGVAIRNFEISEGQAWLLNNKQKPVVVVPDFDGKSGKKLIDSALKYGYAVSFPEWANDPEIKDTNEAVIKYGRLFTLASILKSVEINPLKIQLASRKYFE